MEVVGAVVAGARVTNIARGLYVQKGRAIVHTSVYQHLDALPLLPELRAAFTHMVTHDEQTLKEQQHWFDCIPALQSLLGIDAATIAPFTAAWRLMYASISRLDELQDGDPIGDRLIANLAQTQQYNLIFAYYILAASLLDELVVLLPPASMQRLQRLWSTTMLRMAGGQQRDLSLANTANLATVLQTYQEIAQSKTGATFGLAFGGAAICSSDDPQLIRALTNVGELYGTLLQYSDDLNDADNQPNQTLTFPIALQQAHPQLANPGGQRAFFAHIYQISVAQVVLLLQETWPSICDGVLQLFQQTFDLPVMESAYAR